MPACGSWCNLWRYLNLLEAYRRLGYTDNVVNTRYPKWQERGAEIRKSRDGQDDAANGPLCQRGLTTERKVDVRSR